MDLTIRETFALAVVLGVHPAYLLCLQQYQESFTKKEMNDAYQAGYEDAEQHAMERALGVALQTFPFNHGKGA